MAAVRTVRGRDTHLGANHPVATRTQRRPSHAARPSIPATQVPTAPETGAVDLVLQECAFRGCSKYGLASHNPEARVKMQRCVVQVGGATRHSRLPIAASYCPYLPHAPFSTCNVGQRVVLWDPTHSKAPHPQHAHPAQGSDHACALVHAGSSLEVEGGEMRSSTRGGFCLASYGSTLVARDVFLGAGVGTACIGLHEGAELQAQGCTLLAATSCLAPGGSAGSGAVGGGPAGAGSSSGSGDGSGGGIGLCVNGSMHGKPMKAVMVGGLLGWWWATLLLLCVASFHSCPDLSCWASSQASPCFPAYPRPVSPCLPSPSSS